VVLLRLVLAYCLGEWGLRLLDRIPVVPGEIRIADRVHLQPDRMAKVLRDGGDVVLRAAWKNARWQQENGEPFDLLNAFRNSTDGRIDQPVWIARKQGPALALRLIATGKSADAAAESRRKARRQAQKDGYQLSRDTLAAADWFILVTSLKAAEFATDDVLALYRLRWRVELGFKRLKSVIGLHGPPATDERSARPYLLAHLLMLLLLEPSIDALEDSPHWPTPPDTARPLAPAASVGPLPDAGHYSPPKLSRSDRRRNLHQTTPARTTQEKTHIPEDAPNILAPMGEGRGCAVGCGDCTRAAVRSGRGQ
jgi:hypothetical protein